MTEPRDPVERKQDTLAKLLAPVADAWVASSVDGEPYLVPLSLVWLDDRIVLSLEAGSRTARGITGTGTTRLGVGPTRDVVLIDAVLEQTVAVADAPREIGEGFAAQADWDPRKSPDGYVYLVLRPERIQAYRDVPEFAGRMLMRDGRWLV
jgi:hypothetical protein